MNGNARTALLLGTHSFFTAGLKVGLQVIAEGLSEMGWKIDYVSIGSSPFDLISSDRRRRLTRVWSNGGGPCGVQVQHNLVEYAFRLPFPVHRLFVRSDWQVGWLRHCIPNVLLHKHYDVVIHDASPTVVWLPCIQASRRVFRLNDYPPGFAKVLPDIVVGEFYQRMQEGYDEIWGVSQSLCDWAACEASVDTKVILLENGVSYVPDLLIVQDFVRCGDQRRAVYVGDLDAPWLDQTLLARTAERLPKWQIDLFGPGRWRVRTQPSNISLRGPLPTSAVPRTLPGYDVGLIPFRENDSLIKFLERPLKFYEYIGAGLGVASTDVGSMRSGMGDLACYGNTAKDFADAIMSAHQESLKRPASFADEFLKNHSWASVIDRAASRLDTLLSS